MCLMYVIVYRTNPQNGERCGSCLNVPNNQVESNTRLQGSLRAYCNPDCTHPFFLYFRLYIIACVIVKLEFWLAFNGESFESATQRAFEQSSRFMLLLLLLSQ